MNTIACEWRCVCANSAATLQFERLPDDSLNVHLGIQMDIYWMSKRTSKWLSNWFEKPSPLFTLMKLFFEQVWDEDKVFLLLLILISRSNDSSTTTACAYTCGCMSADLKTKVMRPYFVVLHANFVLSCCYLSKSAGPLGSSSVQGCICDLVKMIVQGGHARHFSHPPLPPSQVGHLPLSSPHTYVQIRILYVDKARGWPPLKCGIWFRGHIRTL